MRSKRYRRTHESRRRFLICCIIISVVGLLGFEVSWLLRTSTSVSGTPLSNEMPPHHSRKNLEETVSNLEGELQFVPNLDPVKPYVIGYAVTMTKSSTSTYLDGAAVLSHSIKLAHRNSSFAYALVAIVHPEVDLSTRQSLQVLGWNVSERKGPVEVEEIEGNYLRGHIRNNGCCGERELLKLWAYTFTQFYRVVHLDTNVILLSRENEIRDSLILQNFDELFDPRGQFAQYGALFTYDWNMARRGRNPPVQGGFLIVRPDLVVFENMKMIVKKGDFRPGSGWGGTGAGSFWGGQTIQGLMAYYYRHLHEDEGLELNRCIYNNMADNPRTAGGFGKGECRDGGKTCIDCRLSNISSIKIVHFTICQKPWECFGGTSCPYCPLCRKLHSRWFAIRSDLERSAEWKSIAKIYDGTYNSENYRGYCRRSGKKGYISLPLDEYQKTTLVFNLHNKSHDTATY